MRKALVVLSLLICSVTSAFAAVSVSIGINVPVYPQLAVIPGYPVYYAPQLNSNYFFYDGMYWVFVDDGWYASSWYNGPWELVAPEFVPLFILRVPVRYYRRPPIYFHAWYRDAAPHWGEHWGHGWEQVHRDWNTWNRAVVPAPAPLPTYQRQYSGARYPRVEQQYALQSQNYRYQPHETVVQKHYQAVTRVQSAPAPLQQSTAPPIRGQPTQTERREVQHPAAAPAPSHQAAVPPSRAQPTQTERTEIHRPPSGPPQAALPSQQAAVPSRGKPPPMERSETQRTASASVASQQHPSGPPHEPMAQRGAEVQKPPQAHKQNQERDNEKGGQGGGAGNK